jgi:hypothetical protein
MEVARQCMPDMYMDYLPDASSMENMLEELCRHAEGKQTTQRTFN